MRLEYIKLGGDTLNNKKVILAAMDKLDTYAKMNREITESEQKQKNSNENVNKKSNGSKGKGKGHWKGNNDGKSKEPNPCKIHNGQNDWCNCPNNPCSKTFKGNNDSNKGDKAKSDRSRRQISRGKSNHEAHFI